MEEYTWCRLSPDHSFEVMGTPHDGQPENLLFAHKVRVFPPWMYLVMCCCEDMHHMLSCACVGIHLQIKPVHAAETASDPHRSRGQVP